MPSSRLVNVWGPRLRLPLIRRVSISMVSPNRMVIVMPFLLSTRSSAS